MCALCSLHRDAEHLLRLQRLCVPICIPMRALHPQALLKKQSSLQLAQTLLAQQRLLAVLSAGPQGLGYDAGRPVAALVAYR